MTNTFNKPHLMIGNTPLLRLSSLSEFTGCDIFIKCEHLNPGGSIKDRAALFMVNEAIKAGVLKPGMTIVEGTAGNTGIGLAVVAKSLGYKITAVMPKGQTIEKQRMISLYGADLMLTEVVPFTNENHFYHSARRLSEAHPQKYWWANQFENLNNFKAHYMTTGPEIWQQTNGKIDAIVSAAGTGGTLAGTSSFLKEKNPQIISLLVDPQGSGLYSHFKTGELKAEGTSITEGIGILRITQNYLKAKIDDAYTFHDQVIVSLANWLRKRDGIVVGSSTAINIAGALKLALKLGPGKTIVTFSCDLGERSYSKLYNEEFLKEKGLIVIDEPLESIKKNYLS